MGRIFSHYPRFLVLQLIRLYQKTLSFDHGLPRVFFPHGYCRFTPTCSQYGYQAIEKYGIIRGGFKAIKRVLRCHPLNPGGHDPLI